VDVYVVDELGANLTHSAHPCVKDYAIAVHGQSGKVMGERPYGLGGLAKAGKLVGRGSMYLGRAVVSKVL
jgi:hypothetical protein